MTRRETESVIVAVPDDMKAERIEKLIRELVEDGFFFDEFDGEHRDGDAISVDIADAPSGVTTPDLMLTQDGLGDEDSIITAFTTEQLQAEIERRRAKESDVIVA